MRVFSYKKLVFNSVKGRYMKVASRQIKGSSDLEFGLYLDSELIINLHGYERLTVLEILQKSFIPSVEFSNKIQF